MLRLVLARLLVLALAASAPVLVTSARAAADTGPGPTAGPTAGPTTTPTAAPTTPPNPDDPTTWQRWAPESYTPPSGPRFNNPYKGPVGGRTLLSQVIHTINSTPGYKLPRDTSGRLMRRSDGTPVSCPENDPSLYPAESKISLYSIADDSFAKAVVAASRRCVSVQVLMNSHLTEANDPSWARIVQHLGHRGKTWDGRRSWARRCSNGCLGTAVLHTKMYLFSQAGAARDIVMTGSSNMSTNAVRVQWNDLFTVKDDATLYGQYRGLFEKMVPNTRASGPWIFHAGPYTSTFYPFRAATAATDRTMRDLRSISCTGATGGAGIHGHSVLYVIMHSWHGTRGLYLAKRVRQMYAQGCYVRILYSFMGKGTYTLLTKNTGPRMVCRRVIFGGAKGIVAVKYAHMKMFAASGNVAGDPSAWVTWTGSNNWTDKSPHADEVTLRIASRPVYDAYIAHWDFIRRRHSAPDWATFEEPTGGGRAPAEQD